MIFYTAIVIFNNKTHEVIHTSYSHKIKIYKLNS